MPDLFEMSESLGALASLAAAAAFPARVTKLALLGPAGAGTVRFRDSCCGVTGGSPGSPRWS